MNRTELAQYIAGNYTSKQYKIALLVLNELTPAQLKEINRRIEETK